MNEELQELQEARETFIGRLFTLGGSTIFLIGSFITAAVAFKAYNRLLQNQKTN
ncbi:hypothetical protein AALF16_15665 [Bacillus cereus]|uniref:hypothetical protein n=1 Tax=Bacillus cereus TaxID=1396 RepID=UPI00356ECDD7